jgi:hypothetical protein
LRRKLRQLPGPDVAFQSHRGAGFKSVDKTGKPLKAHDAINDAVGFNGNETVSDSQSSAYFGLFGVAGLSGKLTGIPGKNQTRARNRNHGN